MSKKSKSAASSAKAGEEDLVPLNEAMKPRKKSAKGKAVTSKPPRKKGLEKPKRTSGLDAAVSVLKEAGKPMQCKDIVQAMLDKGLWKTQGKTPAATIYAAIIREIKARKGESRFKKTERGHFAFNG